jgi:hypothetical protein
MILIKKEETFLKIMLQLSSDMMDLNIVDYKYKSIKYHINKSIIIITLILYYN